MTRRDGRYGFIHIPKSAGSSMVSTLHRVAGDIVHVATPYDLASFSEMFEDAVILSGHIPRFMFDWHKRPRTLMTVLRDPVQRVLSNYRYILTTPGHIAHRYFKRYHPTLAECFGHPILRIEFTDFQTKMLGFSPQNDIVWPAHGRAEFKTFVTEFADFHFHPPTDTMLATAQHRLTTDIRFACLDRPSSVLALCSMMVGEEVPTFDVTNRTPSVSWIPTKHDLDAVAAHNQRDRELYDYALRMIDG
jgi:Sulfotransferase family